MTESRSAEGAGDEGSTPKPREGRLGGHQVGHHVGHHDGDVRSMKRSQNQNDDDDDDAGIKMENYSGQKYNNADSHKYLLCIKLQII